jgi:ABC-type multidrug transport system permease subunit
MLARPAATFFIAVLHAWRNLFSVLLVVLLFASIFFMCLMTVALVFKKCLG